MSCAVSNYTGRDYCLVPVNCLLSLRHRTKNVLIRTKCSSNKINPIRLPLTLFSLIFLHSLSLKKKKGGKYDQRQRLLIFCSLYNLAESPPLVISGQFPLLICFSSSAPPPASPSPTPGQQIAGNPTSHLLQIVKEKGESRKEGGRQREAGQGEESKKRRKVFWDHLDLLSATYGQLCTD